MAFWRKLWLPWLRAVESVRRVKNLPIYSKMSRQISSLRLVSLNTDTSLAVILILQFIRNRNTNSSINLTRLPNLIYFYILLAQIS